MLENDYIETSRFLSKKNELTYRKSRLQRQTNGQVLYITILRSLKNFIGNISNIFSIKIK